MHQTIFRKFYFAFFLSLAAFVGTANAQSNSDQMPGCGTDYYVKKAFANNPSLKVKFDAEEARLALMPKNTTAGEDTLTIPVVIHFIHNFGPENLPEANAIDAIRIINLDYQLRNVDTNQVSPLFTAIKANVRFRFRLATIDPNGNCTRGITRTISALTAGASDNVKDLVSWPTTKYLNVWVVRSIGSGAGGYAYYPGSAPSPAYEGVVVNYNQFGSLSPTGGNLSVRTLTHEIGHYFRLAHTWGSTNTPGLASNCNVDDGVTDTPNTVGMSSQICNKNFTSCGVIANVENYMDYSSCGRMFTLGQKARMRTAANSSTGGRNNLWSVSNLIATGTSSDNPLPSCIPIAYASTSVKVICTSTPVNFSGNYYNVISTDTNLKSKFIIPGAIPDTVIGKTATVVFPNPGKYVWQYIAKNALGADTVFVTDSIKVEDQVGAYLSPVIESFESPTFISDPINGQRWSTTTNGINGVFGWASTAVAAYDGTSSLRVRLASFGTGTTVTLTSPQIDLTALAKPIWLSYFYAYAPTSASNTDAFIIRVSEDCGNTYSVRSSLNQSTDNISTISGFAANNFTPTADQWQQRYISLNSYFGKKIKIQFTVVDGGGSAFYLDQLQITNTLTGIADNINGTALKNRISIQPIPLTATSILNTELAQSGPLQLQLSDMAGRVVYSNTISNTTIGHSSIAIPSQWLTVPSGIYMVRANANGLAITPVKIVIP